MDIEWNDWKRESKPRHEGYVVGTWMEKGCLMSMRMVDGKLWIKRSWSGGSVMKAGEVWFRYD